MPEPQLIGLDVGTTSCKAGLFDGRGRLLALATASYPLERPRPGHVEQDPERYWAAAVQCIREALAAPAADARRLMAMGSCGQAPTMVLLDALEDGGRPVRPAILWQDTRAAAEAEALARDPGTDILAGWMDLRWPVDASFPLARFLWLQRHEPETLARAAITLQPKDFVHYRLTGRISTDPWSAKGLVHQGTWRPVAAIQDIAGVDPRIVPPVASPDEIVGRVTAAAARATGLPAGLPVAAGWTDGMAAMLGTGGFGRAGLGCDVSGTSEVVGLVLPARPTDTGPLMAAPILASGRWVLYGPTQASGASLGWALRVLRSFELRVASFELAEAPTGSGGHRRRDAPEGTGFGPVQAPTEPEATDSGPQTGNPKLETRNSSDLDRALAAAAAVPAGAEGLVFLPYLEGERAPLWDPRARGAFVGLSSGHGPAHLFRAVLEGVACSMRHVLRAAEAATGTRAEEVRVAGGGARLALWNQIKADVTGRALRPCAVTENGVLGAAMLAALGAGLYPDVTAASDAMVQVLDLVAPNLDDHATYARTFARYVALYPRLRDVATPSEP